MFNGLGVKHSVILLIMLTLLVTGLSFIPSDSSVNKANYLEIDDGWNITVAGVDYPDTKVSDVFFDSPHIGDIVTMTTVLPDNDIHNAIIRMYSIHSTVEVYVDGERIYDYGLELQAKGKMLGYGYHYIELPNDYIGKTLEIVMCVTENDAFTSINTPQICNGNTVMKDYVIINKLPLAIILFLIVFGMCILAVSILFVFKNHEFGQLICVGLFSIAIGFWSLCNYDLIMLYTYNLRVKTIIEYLSLFIVPLPICIYFKEEARNRHHNIRYLYMFCTSILSVFLAVAIILQCLNIVHFPAILKIFHIILLLVFSTLISIIVYDIATKKISNPALLIGMLIMCGMGTMDIARYNIQKYVPDFKSSNYVSRLCLGAFVFVISQLADFGVQITKSLCENAQKSALEKMAYSDVLTGIYNRRKCEEAMDEIDSTKNKNFAIISFDLNNLKITNDTLGHEKGDLLLKSFASVLDEVFGGYATVGRMGGDEFIVIFTNTALINIGFLLERLNRRVEKVNERYTDLGISVAYGCCSSRDYPGRSAREIYRVADSLMYERKIAMKRTRA
jgi:diguanylate cyclase (GGDEF)-like protein